MLNLLKRKSAKTITITPDPSATRDDLQIRDLLDNPCLRRAMGLDDDQPAADRRLEAVAA